MKTEGRKALPFGSRRWTRAVLIVDFHLRVAFSRRLKWCVTKFHSGLTVIPLRTKTEPDSMEIEEKHNSRAKKWMISHRFRMFRVRYLGS